MGQIVRCPLIGVPCSKPITVEEKSFFLAEAEKPEDDRQRRKIAIVEALGDQYQLKSALDERGINAFTCKICGMIQTCAYGIADITTNNSNVLFEIGIMIALGKPTIILKRRNQRLKLRLPSDLNAIEVVPFTEYVEIIPQIRQILPTLPPPPSALNPIDYIEKLSPECAEELRKQLPQVEKEFKESVEEAKLATISLGEEKKDLPPGLSERLNRLEEKLENMSRLGVTVDAQTAFLRGNYFHNEGDYEEALANYNWSLKLRPDDPDTLTRRAEIYMHLQRYEEAVLDCNRALELKPDHSEALATRGALYGLLKRYKEALVDFDRSLEIEPDRTITLSNRAIAYYRLGKYEKALADFNHALKLRPDDPDTLNYRGMTYVELGKFDEALADFNRSLELRPDDPDTVYNLACLFSQWGKTDDALGYLEKAITLDKENLENAKTDKDLENIRDDSRFKKLIESG